MGRGRGGGGHPVKLDLQTLLTAIATLVLALGGSGVIATRTGNDKAPGWELAQARSEITWVYGELGRLDARLKACEARP